MAKSGRAETALEEREPQVSREAQIRREAQVSREAAQECSPQPALSEAEGAQAVGRNQKLRQPRRGVRPDL